MVGNAGQTGWYSLLAIVVLTVAQVGCGGLHVYNQSFAQLPYRELVGDDPTENLLDRTTITAVAQNETTFGLWGVIVPPIIPYWGSEADQKNFWIVLTVSARPWDLSFDPRKLELEKEDGSRIPAEGFVGPFKSSTYKIKRLLDVNKLSESSAPFPVTSEISVGVLFATTPPLSDQHFTLVLKGLYRSGQPIAAPVLRFRKRSIRHFEYTFFKINPHAGPDISHTWIVND